MIPHNRPLITEADRKAVDAVLQSGWIAQGSAVAALEAEFVRSFAGGAACALASGTASLYLALKVLGVRSGDPVALPTYACSALLNAVVMAGAQPRLVDVLPDTFCIDPHAVASNAADAATVIAVHAYGAAADIAGLRVPGRRLIEDCCQALGGDGEHGPLGADGDAAVFSFYATKIATGGQGGVIWTRDPELAEAARDFRQFDCRETYVPRFNFQMTDIQAALVTSQMTRLAANRERRQQIAATYRAALAPELAVQRGLVGSRRMVYRLVVLAPDAGTRNALHRHMAEAGVGCIVPIERHELLHRYLNLDPQAFPAAERIADTSLSLPIYPALSDADRDRVCETLAKFRP